MQYAFPLAPINEQKKIVNKISILFAKIDEAKETFKIRREAILKLVFTEELTVDFRNNNSFDSSQQRLMKIREERYKVVESKKELSELDSLFQEEIKVDSNGWLYLKTSTFCHNITCGSTPSKDLSDEGEILFLKVYNIVNNEIDFKYQPQYIPKEVHQGK
ncbi:MULTISPECIES: hypothetical protein [Lysinibacillus]|uniref:hypothetical protein n=1 Tax=Lysinibacillus TaxID=400634 RepID=UPI0018CF10FB|nr:hypothetical protein [Lysinibacillus sphaericus]MBG9757287.1 hypothetical protein [Lysinibacillus sphaericus]QTB12935.1 hypothetical protein J2B92_19380 [Lysinibacillus sphaericus]